MNTFNDKIYKLIYLKIKIVKLINLRIQYIN